MKTCILLTACISPNGMAQTALQDMTQRQTQYLKAIRFYLQKTGLPVVFVENSGHDISCFFPKEIAEHRLEVLTFDGNNYDKTLGKGYGEALIIDYAINHSNFIAHCNSVIKITGRLLVKNINYIINDSKLFNKAEVIASYACPGFLDSRVFIATKPFFITRFLPNVSKLNDSNGFYFEHLLEECTKQCIWRPFLFELPCISGISGTNGTQILSNSCWTLDYWRIMKYNWKCWLNK